MIFFSIFFQLFNCLLKVFISSLQSRTLFYLSLSSLEERTRVSKCFLNFVFMFVSYFFMLFLYFNKWFIISSH